LLIDNVRLLSNSLNAQVVINVARKVAMTKASQSTRTNPLDRKYQLIVADSNKTAFTSSSNATVKINTYPAAPSLSVLPKEGTTNSLNLIWSSDGATNYDIKNGNDIILDNTNLTYHTISGLNANTHIH
jgi:hypothetical protein